MDHTLSANQTFILMIFNALLWGFWSNTVKAAKSSHMEI